MTIANIDGVAGIVCVLSVDFGVEMAWTGILKPFTAEEGLNVS